MKVPTSEAMAATRRLRNVGARMFVVQGNLTGATSKNFIRAVPAKKTACALKFLKRFGVPKVVHLNSWGTAVQLRSWLLRFS